MRTPVIFFLFLSLVFCCPAVVAQSSKVDSLTRVLASMKQDTNRVNTLIALGSELLRMNRQLDSKVELGKALIICNELHYLRGKERTLNALSQLSPPFIKTEERIQFQFERLKVCEDLKDLKCTALSEGILGLRYFSLGDYPRSLEHYYKAIKLNEQLKDTMALAGAHYNLCTLYARTDSTKQAQVHISEYMRLHSLRGDSLALVHGLASLASLHAMKKEYDKALELHWQVLAFHEARNDTSQFVFVLGNIGNVLREKGQRQEALVVLKRAAHVYDVNPNLHPMAAGQVLTQFGQLQLELGLLTEAEKSLQKALQQSLLVTSKRMIRDCYKLLADLNVGGFS